MRLVYVLSLGVITNSYKPFSFTYRRFVSMEAKSGPLRPLQIGLTGSIGRTSFPTLVALRQSLLTCICVYMFTVGMGKSSVSKQFQFLGFEVFDADAAVHELYSKGGEAVPLIRTHFPTAIVDGAVSRPNLSSIIMNEPSSLQVLESIVHPLVASKRMKFLEEAAEKQEFLVVYDM